MREKPLQSFWGMWNISFGFLGLQLGLGLQNANMSRIFQSLGTGLDDLPILWIAAPLTGLLVQPIIGYYSDRTWSKFGRRRPYFLAGAILAAASLLVMPLSPILLFAAMMLWMLDASLNISMEPFRAFVSDMLRTDQHSAGYAVQTALIGFGAVLGSIFPFALDSLGVSNVAADGGIPDTVKYSFWFGAVAILGAMLWTVFKTKEFSPAEMETFDKSLSVYSEKQTDHLSSSTFWAASPWILIGIMIIMAVNQFHWEKEVYLLGALLIAYGLLKSAAIYMAKIDKTDNILVNIIGNFTNLPDLMKRLAVVQFFSWFALFIMWINTTPVVSQYFYGSSDTGSIAYNDGANWVGVLFATYNGVAAIIALTIIPNLSRKIGMAYTHMIGLFAGALGFLSFLIIKDPQWLIISEIGIGFAWCTILSMPYSILASNLPSAKMGIYMGLFNIFIVIPQLLVATIMGSIMNMYFPGDPIWTMAFAAASLLIAALAMLRVQKALSH